MRATKGNAMSATKDSVDRMIHDLRTIVRDGEDLFKATASDVSDKGREARERLGAALGHARDSLAELEERIAAGARAADRVVHTHPYPVIGAAFGIGLLIGALATRR
jgi:ElaB/YqjD/DUF883 family membrane-anchored ribosome-binding protein